MFSTVQTARRSIGAEWTLLPLCVKAHFCDLRSPFHSRSPAPLLFSTPAPLSRICGNPARWSSAWPSGTHIFKLLLVVASYTMASAIHSRYTHIRIKHEHHLSIISTSTVPMGINLHHTVTTHCIYTSYAL